MSQSNLAELCALTAAKNETLWLGNTTVGAGLPINFAIKDLLNSGDEITEIPGILSGTLLWLFQTFNDSVSFSELFIDALSQGLAEPDTRDDLSGRDVHRKLLILSRSAGFSLSLEDIKCQNLVPKHLQTLSKSEFLARTNELDEFFAEQLTSAQDQQSCIRYIARFSVTKNDVHAQVSLETLKNDDTFANLTAGDNIFKVKTQWYFNNPLIIQDPGAGRDVTAGGLHSDLVNICQ